jgi:hypothetical protein
MTHKEREKIIKQLLSEAEKLRIQKGYDYSGIDDANSNFKNAGKRLGLHPEQVLFVYLDKHLEAIHTFIKDGKVKSEPIGSRIKDAVNYLLIFASLLKESTLQGRRK